MVYGSFVQGRIVGVLDGLLYSSLVAHLGMRWLVLVCEDSFINEDAQLGMLWLT
jgi:hypothetical protein